MQPLDIQVLQQAKLWLEQDSCVWLCTVLSTFGSAPREPGSMLAANAKGKHCGSLSGGCIEEHFLENVQSGQYQQPTTLVHYGNGGIQDSAKVKLPCDGSLRILVERLEPSPDILEHLNRFEEYLKGPDNACRRICLSSGESRFVSAPEQGPKVVENADAEHILIRVGPVARLILAGISPVAEFCAQFAKLIGYQVIACDPDAEACAKLAFQGIQTEMVFPAEYLAQSANVHNHTAVVALTHDPRNDDLAVMEAIQTPAFYIGVMGSQKTSANRRERLQRIGGLTDAELDRIHMPIGLALGSKTPAEIGLAIVADILRIQRGRAREDL